MAHHASNSESREAREEHDERRQEAHDEAFDETGGVDDRGSQDERRHEGDRSRADGTVTGPALDDAQLDDVAGAGYPQGSEPPDVLIERWKKR